MNPFRSLRLMGLCLLALPAMAAPPTPRPAAESSARTISVPGEGEASAAPDNVTFTVGLSRDGADAKSAKLELTNAARSVTAALRQHGVAEADLATAAVTLAPNERFDGGKRAITGYRAGTAITASLHSLDGYEAALAAAMQAGTDELRGVLYASSRQGELEVRARANAVADARRRADALATAAGATVGRILSVAESPVERPTLPGVPQLRLPVSPRGDGGPGGGTITVRVSIQAVWALE